MTVHCQMTFHKKLRESYKMFVSLNMVIIRFFSIVILKCHNLSSTDNLL